MFGRNNSVARQAVAVDTPATSADSGPTFPLYLLPSFSLPFRRRRPSSTHHHKHQHHYHQAPASISYNDNDNDNDNHNTPSPSSSLSSSPASSASSNPDLPNPNFHSYFASDIPDLHAAPEIQKPPAPQLTRIHPDTLRCGHCSTDIAHTSQIVSKGFTGRHGRAYLVSPPPCTTNETAATATATNLINTTIGRSETRRLVTGEHVVADISCLVCGTTLGWKYVDAREPAQRYKVGKFILETKRVVPFRSWEDLKKKEGRGKANGGGNAVTEGRAQMSSGRVEENNTRSESGEAGPRDDGNDKEGAHGGAYDADDMVMFDSDDEDECDDIFAGVWDAEVVAERRRGRVNNRSRNDTAVVGY
ncbi:yippee zinc-binding/DNA-binding /Mis18, centromere assembly-domain-containing protein [Podospora appendiculata]|uniref:Yippee zinc-binding/DNA-binding /Mis18, centromere assembly-domain-containing protein n=1 Tax=Podospora appendiculata TaxID=314037 RepID=A0AAE0WZD3_9PEZI|nr:yippee zinc-binding/DNA-binding /Mis18, centromere assembly-domain-containing protein [Podospora appendiculata]